jgi:1-acyl-sn-glycerol-3-phosphate acyltransferase
MRLKDEFKLLTGGRDWRGRSRTPRSALPWEPARPPREFPTGWARTPTARAIRTGLRRGVLKPLAWSQTRPVVEGLEYLDGLTGPAIFVSNHTSHLDAPLILGSMPQRYARSTALGAAADYFFEARWRAMVTTLVFNAFPVDRHGGRRSKSLAPRLLDAGWSLLLFPEGTRTPDGWMAPFRQGAAVLCSSRGIPAVPISLRGTFQAMPRGQNWPSRGRPPVVVRYGRPLWPAEGESARQFSDRLTAAVNRLWAEEDLGWYQALRAQSAGELPAATGPRTATWRRVWESTRPPRDDRYAKVWE